MLKNYIQNTTLKFLEIISYTEDKQAFLEDFNQLVGSYLIVDLTDGLPTAEKQNITKMFNDGNEEESLQKLLESYSQEELLLATKLIVKRQLENLLETLFDEIDEEKYGLAEEFLKGL